MTFGGADLLRHPSGSEGPGPLLDIRSPNVQFAGHAAVKSLDLRIDQGETLALVGESGCGKSTTALAILRLLPYQVRLSGTVAFEGRDLLALKSANSHASRQSALDHLSEADDLAEPIALHRAAGDDGRAVLPDRVGDCDSPGRPGPSSSGESVFTSMASGPSRPLSSDRRNDLSRPRRPWPHAPDTWQATPVLHPTPHPRHHERAAS